MEACYTPECLFKNTVNVWQSLAVIASRKAICADDSVNFLLCFFLDVLVERHHQEESEDGRPCLDSTSIL